MAKDLKKFVNPLFLRTVPLDLLTRLLRRHDIDPKHFDPTLLDHEPGLDRQRVIEFLKGPEDAFPAGLVIDLHQIADLGTRDGLEMLLRQARRTSIRIIPEVPGARREDPRHVALATFLNHPEVFAAAHEMLDFYRSVGIWEIVGGEDGVEPDFDDENLGAFERDAAALFEAHLHGDYCKAEAYDDDGELVLHLTHGAPMRTATIIENRDERVIPFREAEQTILSYGADEARLKMFGVGAARRVAMAELFAKHVLGKPGFFAGYDAQNLYSLERIERVWPHFRLNHAFDPGIRTARIVEAQVDRVTRDLFGEIDRVEWSLIVRDSKQCAIGCLDRVHPAIEFGSGDWRLSHVVMRVQIDAGGRRPSTVRVTVKPRTKASFKRQRFEDQIMRFLRRNGFCRDRDAERAAVAAE